jgi:hypothetical protein
MVNGESSATKDNHNSETTRTSLELAFYLTLSLRDLPLLAKGEGRFGNAKTG